jgi:hypothetical protein
MANTREVLTEYFAEVAEAFVSENGATMSDEAREVAKTFLVAGFALGANSVIGMLAPGPKSSYLEEQHGRLRQLIASASLPSTELPTRVADREITRISFMLFGIMVWVLAAMPWELTSFPATATLLGVTLRGAVAAGIALWCGVPVVASAIDWARTPTMAPSRRRQQAVDNDEGIQLRPLPSPGITRLQRYYERLRHPSAPGLSLTGSLSCGRGLRQLSAAEAVWRRRDLALAAASCPRRCDPIRGHNAFDDRL